MQDLPNHPERPPRLSNEGEQLENVPLSPEEIQSAIDGTAVVPDQNEINASIEALKPASSLVEQSEFTSVTRKLVEGYNARQLAQYLVGCLGGRAAETSKAGKDNQKPKLRSEHKAVEQAQWRPGRRPIEERVGRISLEKASIGSSKIRLAEQIVRAAWSLTTYTEEQQIGELEILAKPWQIKMLFDLTLDGKPSLERFIPAGLVRQTLDVRPYRPDNVIRITGRRRESEETARQLEKKLAATQRLDMNLNVMKPLIGKPGGPQDLKSLFKPPDVAYVSERTGSVIDISSDASKLTIHCAPGGGDNAAHARRLLLSLLDLPSPKTVTSFVVREKSYRKGGKQKVFKTYLGNPEDLTLMETPLVSPPRRQHGASLHRIVAPALKRDPEQSAKSDQASNNRGPDPPSKAKNSSSYVESSLSRSRVDRLMKTLTGLSDSAPGKKSTKDQNPVHSSWKLARGGAMTPWSAMFCTLLRPSPEDLTAEMKRLEQSTEADSEDGMNGEAQKGANPLHSKLPFTTVSQLPGLGPLLSYFEPATPAGLEEGMSLEMQNAVRHRASINQRPHLRASFIPNPFSQPYGLNALKRLPRITFSYRVMSAQSKRLAGSSELNLYNVKATLEKQEVQLPFPAEAVDMSFTRTRNLYMPAKNRNRATANIEEFTRRLADSMGKRDGALDAMPEVDMPLPWRSVEGSRTLKAAGRDKPHNSKVAGSTVDESDFEDVHVPYLLEKLEQIQSMEFVPTSSQAVLERIEDPEARKLLENWPQGLMLQIRDVEGGATGGRSTELRLISGTSSTPDGRHAKHEPEQDEEQVGGAVEEGGLKGSIQDEKSAGNTRALVQTAASILRLITRANAKELPVVKIPSAR